MTKRKSKSAKIHGQGNRCKGAGPEILYAAGGPADAYPDRPWLR